MEKTRGGKTIMILVTGAANRLGRLVVGRLIEQGYEVLGTDRLPYNGSPSPFVQADSAIGRRRPGFGDGRRGGYSHGRYPRAQER